MFLTFKMYIFDGTQNWEYKVNILCFEIEFYNFNLNYFVLVHEIT